MTYTLTEEGEVIVREQLKADKDAKVAPMMRYGNDHYGKEDHHMRDGSCYVLSVRL